MADTPTDEARAIWHGLETVHAVVYFAPEVTTAFADLGLKGFWMGYFASRAAALGAVPPDVVTATFFNFHPAMVARALPDAWAIAPPSTIATVRRTAVGAALARLVADDGGSDDLDGLDRLHLDELADLAVRAARATSLPGRPLAAAHRTLVEPSDALERLWWAATILREHRGDAHVALLVAHGLDGCEAHVLQAASGRVPAETLRPNRGWSEGDWHAASARLQARGWITDDGYATRPGIAVRNDIEAATDQLSTAPYDALDAAERTRLRSGLEPITNAVRRADVIPFPNPMGLAPTPF